MPHCLTSHASPRRIRARLRRSQTDRIIRVRQTVWQVDTTAVREMHMDWENQARAQRRSPGGLRVAWASLFAALCLALPIGGTAQGTRPRPAAPLEAIPAILDAFRSHRVVSFPGGHTDANEVQALLRALVKDPRFAATVNDIVVEFGSSRYQDLMDRYIRGEDVPQSALQRAWLDAVQGGTALDNDNTALFFSAVREANATVPAERRIRVLLGDPPID